MDHKAYYEAIRQQDIGEVARDLFGERITREDGRVIYVDCPNHASQSHESLQINKEKETWHCFGCCEGGDLLQLVEFVEYGCVTKGRTGAMPESHRLSRDWLAARVGMAPLAGAASPERQEQAEKTRRVLACLTELAEIYHEKLCANAEIAQWLKLQYGFDEAVLKSQQIGYADNDGIVPMLLDAGYTPAEILATGAFRRCGEQSEDLAPFFENRVTFPYMDAGLARYMIGRKTDRTPDNKYEAGKYKKLPVHDPAAHPGVDPGIHNGHLYNEGALSKPGECTVITEGVTDCISLIAQGIPAVSPCTVNMRVVDMERIIPRLQRFQRTLVCFDQEVSNVGTDRARVLAAALAEHGVAARVVMLPLQEGQVSARQHLGQQYGITDGKSAAQIQKNLLPEAHARVAELLARAKLDINTYFTDGGTLEGFRQAMQSAKTPLEIRIAELEPEVANGAPEAVDRVLEGLLDMPPMERDRHLRLIQDRLGKVVTLDTLRHQLKACDKRRQECQARDERERLLAVDPADRNSCREAVEAALATTEGDHAFAAHAAYEWLLSHGAQFFRTKDHRPFMYFGGYIYWLEALDKGLRRDYLAFMYKQTGIVQTNTRGRDFYEVLVDLAHANATVREPLTWLQTDVVRKIVYFCLANDRNEVAKISPAGVEIILNGSNDDGVVLQASPKMSPVTFNPDADPDAAHLLVKQLILENLACERREATLVVMWASCFLLIEFAGTRPMTRFEGTTESAKTTAAKILSTLIFGEPQQKKSTNAANYADGAVSPAIFLDNLENAQMTDTLISFMLMSVTGIVNEKRKAGTDSGTVCEQTKCLLNTSGIEPLRGDLGEILTRTLLIRFDRDRYGKASFVETEAIAEIKAARDKILSVIMMRTAKVLELLRDGAMAKVMLLLHTALGDHGKRRCNDFFSLMYLMMLAGESDAEIGGGLETIKPAFVECIMGLNETTNAVAVESNPIAAVLATLFNAYRQAAAADRSCEGVRDDDFEDALSTGINVTKFRERYLVTFEDESCISGVLARDLHASLSRIARDFSIPFDMRSGKQLAQRILNDKKVILEAGFDIQEAGKDKNTTLYRIVAAQSGLNCGADGRRPTLGLLAAFAPNGDAA